MFTPPWWRVVIAGVTILVIGAILLAMLSELLSFVFLVILGTSIAAGLDPLVRLLARWMPRGLAVILVMLAIVAVFGLILWIVLPPLAEQGQQLIARAPEFYTRLQERYAELVGRELEVVPLLESTANQLTRVGSTLLAVPLGLFSGLFSLVLVLFITLYMLMEAPDLYRFLLSLYPEGSRGRAREVIRAMAEAMGGFIRGTTLVSLVVGLLTYLGLLIIGIPFPLVLGLLAGLLEFIPYIGPFLAAIPMVLIALTESPTHALIVLVYFVIIQQLESNVLVPNIQRTQTDLSPLTSILALTAGSILAGLIGVLAAIPLAAALRVFVKKVVAPEIRRRSEG